MSTEQQYMRASLGEFQINKSDEFLVSGNLVMGIMFDEMTLNVFKVQENGGCGELLEQHTQRYPVAPTGGVFGGKLNVMRKLRSMMLERALFEFEKTNNHGILFV
ncbi:hypothetical protein [Bacillus sp. S0628]|uniref:hypothetical protein n=1 Tax=Bacillus sp. S0628 TaxID=2957802 RepID=UPI00209EE6FE|nr:hypothetical protein [Bacillus sp. S0628]MCP1322070.1 hypothetical protein [Bacillus sp. S0628]